MICVAPCRHLRESCTASPSGFGWSRPHAEPDDAPHCSRVLFYTAKCEIVRAVDKKLCDIALDADTEQKSTAEVPAMRRSTSFWMAMHHCQFLAVRPCAVTRSLSFVTAQASVVFDRGHGRTSSFLCFYQPFSDCLNLVSWELKEATTRERENHPIPLYRWQDNW